MRKSLFLPTVGIWHVSACDFLYIVITIVCEQISFCLLRKHVAVSSSFLMMAQHSQQVYVPQPI